MIAAVLFDLDDTLYPQSQFLDAAWDAVARAGAAAGVLPVGLRAALSVVAAQGSDRGRIIDRALALADGGTCEVQPLVSAFLTATPDELTPYPGVVEALAEVRFRVPIGLVTDGAPDVQRAKLRALRLEDAFDVVVLSDVLGRAFRKPDPTPFLAAARALGVDPSDVVVVGDRPDKDVAGALAAGMEPVRVVSGEYAHQADPLPLGSRVGSVVEAVAALRARLPDRRRTVVTG